MVVVVVVVVVPGTGVVRPAPGQGTHGLTHGGRCGREYDACRWIAYGYEPVAGRERLQFANPPTVHVRATARTLTHTLTFTRTRGTCTRARTSIHPCTLSFVHVIIQVVVSPRHESWREFISPPFPFPFPIPFSSLSLSRSCSISFFVVVFVLNPRVVQSAFQG